MTVLELSELIKEMEEKFGVSRRGSGCRCARSRRRRRRGAAAKSRPSSP